jgi:hypothetical protein
LDINQIRGEQSQEVNEEILTWQVKDFFVYYC